MGRTYVGGVAVAALLAGVCLGAAATAWGAPGERGLSGADGAALSVHALAERALSLVADRVVAVDRREARQNPTWPGELTPPSGARLYLQASGDEGLCERQVIDVIFDQAGGRPRRDDPRVAATSVRRVELESRFAVVPTNPSEADTEATCAALAPSAQEFVAPDEFTAAVAVHTLDIAHGARNGAAAAFDLTCVEQDGSACDARAALRGLKARDLRYLISDKCDPQPASAGRQRLCQIMILHDPAFPDDGTQLEHRWVIRSVIEEGWAREDWDRFVVFAIRLERVTAQS